MELEVLGARNLASAESRLASLRLDGFLGVDAGSLSVGLPFQEQLRIRAVLLSHPHFDHIRDLFTLGLFRAYQGPIDLYATAPTLELVTGLFNGRLYPDFVRWPQQQPVYRPHPLEPHQTVRIEGYEVLPLPVTHPGPGVGFSITSPQGRSLFYSGDSGPGLSAAWKEICPHLLVLEVTGPDRLEETMRRSGHLTPRLLKEELEEFRRAQGYLPPVLLVHYTPQMAEELAGEIARVARELGASLTLATDGMKLQV